MVRGSVAIALGIICILLAVGLVGVFTYSTMTLKRALTRTRSLVVV